MNLPPGLRALALERDGVLTAADMRRHGLSRPAVQRRIESGDLIRMAGRLYRVADHPLTLRTRARVATLAVSPRAALC
ncbi:type IV toxin-antitoxin system AbiEi family antitoxin domain-containing protein, partial [Gordonia sp. ABSL11-1]|uniref:type IV toxin-antitoxin system AbiEi family antitoxin domain-containing protein n=1 Tax=Gordonia sp. ABSL11-1 TaxID=3053924 RepID=UPI00257415F4